MAANQVPLDVDRCIDAGENVTVETVLSSDKYEAIIKRARSIGYQVAMIYLALESAETSRSRVARRVATGGHDVPEDRIRPRWRRSLENLIRFAPLLDELIVYLSTSRHGLILLAQKREGKMYWYGGRRFQSLHLRLGAQKPPKSGPDRGGILPLT
jgi:predicted ABC-type ATPase